MTDRSAKPTPVPPGSTADKPETGSPVRPAPCPVCSRSGLHILLLRSPVVPTPDGRQRYH